MNIQEILIHVRAEESDRAVSRLTGIARQTVKKYRAWARENGLLIGPLPELGSLHKLLEATLPEHRPPQNISSAIDHKELVLNLRNQEPPVEVAAVFQRLVERGFDGSYSSVYRMVKALEPERLPEGTARVETGPGQEAQVDFGSAGLMVDPDTGELRKTWVFVMVLSNSRHLYVEFVFDQKVVTWLKLHQHAFEWFGGIPRRIKLDNLKAAIVKAAVDEPQVQLAYRECAEYFHFLISPCRVRTPEHKGKVESGVHYVARNFLAGQPRMNLREANKKVLDWIIETAGTRVHGTTKKQPLAVFLEAEKNKLQPLPMAPFDPGEWKSVRLHRDCHVVFNQAYYSAPHRFIGQQLWVRGGLKHVRIFTENHELVATHDPAPPGGRQTHPDHVPPRKKEGLFLTPENCLERARQVGAQTLRLVEDLLADQVLDRIPTVARILRLGDEFTPDRLEAACVMALGYGDGTLQTVRGILKKGLDLPQGPSWALLPPATEFTRTVDEIMGGTSWN